MPSRSKAQADLMRAAEHGASFPMAQKVRSSMTKSQMHEFAVTPTKGLPGHVAALNSHPHAPRLGAFLHPKKMR